MSKKSITVVKKSDPSWGKGGKTTAPTTSSTTSSPTVSPQNAQTIQPSPVPKAPPRPGLSPVQQQISNAHSLLERSEGRSGTNGVDPNAPGAHARHEHVGRKGSELESRDKQNDGAFLNNYEQDKALAMTLNTTKGKNTWSQSNVSQGKFDNSLPLSKLSPHMTAPITRQVRKKNDGTYEHFNAKVTGLAGKFTKDTGMKEGRRVQTLFGMQSTPLPKPLPGGQLPTTKVSLNGINEGNLNDLRKTTTQVKGSMSSDTIGSNAELLPRTKDGTTARPELGTVVDPPKVHQPVGESTNAPSPTPITSDEGSSVSSDTTEGEVVSNTEGGGTEVGGVPSEGVSTEKQVENTVPDVVQPTPKVTAPSQPKKSKKKFKQVASKKKGKKGKGVK
jgi:hypothetical protein